jgi:putative phosphoribosyl transferase
MADAETSALPPVHIQQRVNAATPDFRDRYEAGEALAAFAVTAPDPDAIVLGLPRGGVPVGAPVADRLGCALDTIIVRKLPIPASPEMGFGAITLGGGLQINEEAVRRFAISQKELEAITDEVRDELKRRARLYRGTDELPPVTGRAVYLVDDGLATGFTALAATQALQDQKPRSITIAVPVSPIDSVERVRPHVDSTYALRVKTTPSFAVASFYQQFPDLSDEEVREYLDPRSRRKR